MPEEYLDHPDGSLREVTISLGGDFVSASDSPLLSAPLERQSRAEVKKKLYAVNIIRNKTYLDSYG